MSDEMLVRFCSPTLAGIKTGSLFSYPINEGEDIEQTLRELNHRLCGKGVSVFLMSIKKNKALIYLYRPKLLRQDLKGEESEKLLRELGYDTEKPGRCIMKLRDRLQDYKDFPHEIGLFLGYPAVDVRGFIENHAENYKTIGMWKVYGDENSALESFRKFKKCTSVYTEQLKKGRPLEELAIAR